MHNKSHVHTHTHTQPQQYISFCSSLVIFIPDPYPLLSFAHGQKSTSNLSGEGPLILQLVLLRTLTPMLLLMLILTIVLLYSKHGRHNHVHCANTTLLQCPDLLHFTFADRLPEEHSYHTTTSTKYYQVFKCQVPYLCSLL